eukprot:scaffold385_cov182-Ochromonas_danica.AAC.10
MSLPYRASKKEFSNDPGKGMQELSQVFQSRLTWIQDSIKKLKEASEIQAEVGLSICLFSHTQSSLLPLIVNLLVQQTLHLQQHKRYIAQWLTKSMAAQINAFKLALKEHGKHVAERNKRVMQYGGSEYASSDSKSFAMATPVNKNPLAENAQKYAMFGGRLARDSSPLVRVDNGNSHAGNRKSGGGSSTLSNDQGSNPKDAGVGFLSSTGLHQRAATTQGKVGNRAQVNLRNKYDSVNSNSDGDLQQQQQQQQQRYVRKDDFRLRAAEKVESSIRQMGELFSQMASLVAEQGETISRIEDDVEEGLINTKEAHDSIQQCGHDDDLIVDNVKRLPLLPAFLVEADPEGFPLHV